MSSRSTTNTTRPRTGATRRSAASGLTACPCAPTAAPANATAASTESIRPVEREPFRRAIAIREYAGLLDEANPPLDQRAGKMSRAASREVRPDANAKKRRGARYFPCAFRSPERLALHLWYGSRSSVERLTLPPWRGLRCFCGKARASSTHFLT